jgi:hypothetical protein
MGHGHVKTVWEGMIPSCGGVCELAAGDKEGLRELGASGGCIRVMEPIDA